MGIGFGSRCLSNPYSSGNRSAIAPNPQSDMFEILEIYQIGNNTVAKIRYIGCTNFEGIKICLFKDLSIKEIEDQTHLDPHFSESEFSPFARFKPTKDGWEAAIELARILS